MPLTGRIGRTILAVSLMPLLFRRDAHLARGDCDRVVAGCEAAMGISGREGISCFHVAIAIHLAAEQRTSWWMS